MHTKLVVYVPKRTRHDESRLVVERTTDPKVAGTDRRTRDLPLFLPPGELFLMFL
jgi:hypothetical protein